MKISLLLLVFINFSLGFSQNSEGFHLKSIDFGLGIYNDQNNTLNYGISGNTEVAAGISSNIIAINVAYGVGLINKNQNDLVHNYWDFDLLYGREFKITNVFTTELQTGIGYITQVNNFFEEDTDGLTIPVRLKFKYITGKKLNIGLNPNVSINKVNTLYSLHLFLEYNFRK